MSPPPQTEQFPLPNPLQNFKGLDALVSYVCLVFSSLFLAKPSYCTLAKRFVSVNPARYRSARSSVKKHGDLILFPTGQELDRVGTSDNSCILGGVCLKMKHPKLWRALLFMTVLYQFGTSSRYGKMMLECREHGVLVEAEMEEKRQ